MPNEADELEAITQRAVADLVEVVSDPGVTVPAEVRAAVAAALRESHGAVYPFRAAGQTIQAAVTHAQQRAQDKIRALLFPFLPAGVSEDTTDLLRDSIGERVARFDMDITETLLRFMREELERRRRPH